MDLGITQKVALVTGAGRGLGSGICASLAREGAIIVACARSGDDLSKLITNLAGTGHKMIALDLEATDGRQDLRAYVGLNEVSTDIAVNKTAKEPSSHGPCERFISLASREHLDHGVYDYEPMTRQPFGALSEIIGDLNSHCSDPVSWWMVAKEESSTRIASER